jgi:RNA polymerase sigma-70 factor (ECF subfamily)
MTPLLAQRSDRAFERMYQRHVGDVYRYALVVLRNPEDAEDVTQTTFMNAYRAFQRGERPRAPQNWLIAIAHNVCRQRFRQAQRRPNELPLEDDVADQVPSDESPTAEDIRRALGHLAFNQRAALVMRELEGRSYQEIAELLGLSLSAVETLIFRARRALREQLEGGLTCNEAELAVSKQLDGRLGRKEKGQLRAHLRECEECSRFARSQRAQRAAIRSLAAIPLPSSLASFFGGGGGGAALVGGGLATKAALVGATAIVATGVGVETAKHTTGFTPIGAKAKVAVVEPSTKSAAQAHARASEQATTPPAQKAQGRAAVTEPKPHGRALGHSNQKAKAKPRPARPVVGPAVVVNPPARAKPNEVKPEKVGPAVRINPPVRARKKPKRVKPIVGKPPRPPRNVSPPPPAPRGPKK